MLAGVSTRRYRRTQEPVGQEVEQQARSTSRSSVSRTFIERTRRSLGGLMSRRLDDVRLAVMMIDGIDLGERTNVVALGITTEGVKIPLGLWEGSTENASVATALLSDLVERGLDPEQGILFVLDGAKALRTVFGDAPVQRCVRHKERSVLDQLRQLGRELDHSYPGAAGSLREGMEETLTLTRLGVSGNLERTLESTNPVESMIEIVRWTQRNVKRWSSGEMALRWTAAGMLEAERQFRKIIGYRDLATLLIAIERDHHRRHTAHLPAKEAAIVVVADPHTRPSPRDRKERTWERSS
jgi:putative transposase